MNTITAHFTAHSCHRPRTSATFIAHSCHWNRWTNMIMDPFIAHSCRWRRIRATAAGTQCTAHCCHWGSPVWRSSANGPASRSRPRPCPSVSPLSVPPAAMTWRTPRPSCLTERGAGANPTHKHTCHPNTQTHVRARHTHTRAQYAQPFSARPELTSGSNCLRLVRKGAWKPGACISIRMVLDSYHFEVDVSGARWCTRNQEFFLGSRYAMCSHSDFVVISVFVKHLRRYVCGFFCVSRQCAAVGHDWGVSV